MSIKFILVMMFFVPFVVIGLVFIIISQMMTIPITKILTIDLEFKYEKNKDKDFKMYFTIVDTEWNIFNDNVDINDDQKNKNNCKKNSAENNDIIRTLIRLQPTCYLGLINI